MLTELLTMTKTHKFPSLVVHKLGRAHVVLARLVGAGQLQAKSDMDVKSNCALKKVKNTGIKVLKYYNLYFLAHE